MSRFSWPVDQPTLGGPNDPERLRPWAECDINSVHTACQDPEIQRWTTVPVPYLPEHARGYITELAPAQWRDRTAALFCVAASDDDRVLGACGLVSVHAGSSTAEVGYWLAPTARGRGTAARAVMLLADWALGSGGLGRLEFHIDGDNEASHAVARNLGCVGEGPELWTLSSPAGPATA